MSQNLKTICIINVFALTSNLLAIFVKFEYNIFIQIKIKTTCINNYIRKLITFLVIQ